MKNSTIISTKTIIDMLIFAAYEQFNTMITEYINPEYTIDEDNLVVDVFDGYNHVFSVTAETCDKDGVAISFKEYGDNFVGAWGDATWYNFQPLYRVFVNSTDEEKTVITFVHGPWHCDEEPTEYVVMAETEKAAMDKAAKLVEKFGPVEVVVSKM